MDFQQRLQEIRSDFAYPKILLDSLEAFYSSYAQAVSQNGVDVADCQEPLLTFLDLLEAQLKSPFIFEPFHKKIRKPKDLYRFGIDFIRPLVQLEKSKILGLDIVEEIETGMKRGENAILFANHQIEPDPQAISLLLEKTYPDLVDRMIFVAGHRVTTDPMAVPLSMGCNLLCIYSKNYIDHPPEEKPRKIAHNQHTMKTMRDLLTEGGQCIYVAPSGGRDRPNAAGVVEVAPFDHQSIEMFHFIAKQSKTPTRFYPLALNTYPLLPPPDEIKKSLGEKRLPNTTPIHLAFGKEILFEQLPISINLDKKAQRIERARCIRSLVDQLYQLIV
ncbi:glycerol-3-phosphate acyltransferase,chloroplastic [Waddlia chondrophila 2032/99]|uniref:Glycerol-3-phosphate acyltransferase n=2 Tax=Waddlia chondrophila TaxID=71667 RepID=D6YUG1_WADCW|nr:1-acyl-sn-glycerol-3-phosphate acyltransferase [Waddlia chondrophila]ADI37772.1 glycerol-3-phosphate acyltransferase [Waddlia chondrophila WSU 86-1044]CCB91825.1 glycerol-3-phosphate acyltransferase,chloroplastic [Waddlia chondrophila 2032/99]